MTNRWANAGFLLLVLAAGLGYLWYARDIALTRLDADLGPIVFPVALGAGVVVLGLIELVRTIRNAAPQEDEPFRIPNLWRLVATVGLIGAHFLVWQKAGHFYPATAALFVALVLLFRMRLSVREISIALAVSLAFTLMLYLVFQVAFGIALD